MLFDWLVVGQVVSRNPAGSVRGPKHSTKKGKMSVLSTEEMRTLLDSINIRKLIGLRDRAIIGLMGYTFARVGAVVTMKVEDYYVQKRRGWIRLHEKGGKVNELPCHHNLEQFLDEWLTAFDPLWRIRYTAVSDDAPWGLCGPDAVDAVRSLPNDQTPGGLRRHRDQD